MEWKKEEMVAYFKAVSQHVSKDKLWKITFKIAGPMAANNNQIPPTGRSNAFLLN
jgi:hypothetical protein